MEHWTRRQETLSLHVILGIIPPVWILLSSSLKTSDCVVYPQTSPALTSYESMRNLKHH